MKREDARFKFVLFEPLALSVVWRSIGTIGLPANTLDSHERATGFQPNGVTSFDSFSHLASSEIVMPRRAAFRIDDLELVEKATHEPIIVGDFVRLASGGPQGLVSSVEGDMAQVAWLTSPVQHSALPWLCLRPSAQR